MFDAIEPFGDRRGDWQAASIAQAAVRPHVKGELKVQDFLPFAEDRFDPAPSEDDQWLEWGKVLERAAMGAQIREGME